MLNRDSHLVSITFVFLITHAHGSIVAQTRVADQLAARILGEEELRSESAEVSIKLAEATSKWVDVEMKQADVEMKKAELYWEKRIMHAKARQKFAETQMAVQRRKRELNFAANGTSLPEPPELLWAEYFQRNSPQFLAEPHRRQHAGICICD